MKKITHALILAFLVSVCCFSLCAQAESYEGLVYTVSNGVVTITGNEGLTDEVLIIPEQIEGYPVVAIGEDAFQKCTQIKSVTFPSSLKRLEHSAFRGCSNLESVYIPDGVTYIGYYAFDGCNLKSIAIPDSITYIGYRAFANNTNVSSIKIGNSVKSIGDFAFENLKNVTSVIVPDSVTSIGEGAFKGCDSLEEITLPYATFGSERASRFGYIFGYELLIENYMPAVPTGTTDQKYYEITTSPGYVTTYRCYYYYIPSSLKKVTITKAETIDENTFYNCANIEEIELGKTVKNVGRDAFYNCKWYNDLSEEFCVVGDEVLIKYNGDAEEIILPTNVKRIADYLFYKNSNITNVVFHDEIISIGKYAFYETSRTSSFTIPNSVVEIGEYAFKKYATIKCATNSYAYEYVKQNSSYNLKVQLLDQREQIGEDVFYYIILADNTAEIVGCNTTSTAITIPTTLGGYPVTVIGDSSFEECTTLTSVTIISSVTRIGKRAFYGCTGMVDVTIPPTVESVGDYAFYGCTSLTNATISEGVKSIGDFAFYGCTALKEAVVPDSVETLGVYAYYGCSALTEVTLGINLGKIEGFTFANCKNLSIIVVGTSVESIGDYAFLQTAITRITLPASVKTIGSFAFKDCKSLTRVQMRNGIETIGGGAFKGASALYQINLPGTLTSVGAYAFEDCAAVTEITLPSGVTRVEAATFKNCTMLVSVIIEGDVEYIDSYAFSNCGFSEFVLPETLVGIGDRAFSECKSLINIYIPDRVETLGEGVFYCCSSLANVSVADELGVIGKDTFYETDNVAVQIRNLCGTITDSLFKEQAVVEVKIAEGITSTGEYTFEKCAELTTVLIGEGLVEIGNYAFSGCKQLATINLPETLTTIGDYAFEFNEGHIKMIFPDAIKTIGSNAFANCINLRDISVPDTLESIGDDAFVGCSEIAADIRYINGVVGEELFLSQNVKYVVINDGITTIKPRAFCVSKVSKISMPDTVVDIGHNAFFVVQEVELTIKKSTGVIVDNLFRSDSDINRIGNITSVLIGDDMNKIGSYVFYDCNTLNSIVIGKNMGVIDDNAFANSSLVTISMGDGIGNIENRAFHNCTKLKTVDIGDEIKSIGDFAFYGCVALTDVSVGEGLNTIGNSAFYGCKSLLKLLLPETVTSIGSYAFYDCNSMASINIPTNVTEIEEYTFYGCASLQSAELPDGVTSIGDYAYYGCTSLSEVLLGNSLKSIAGYAFYNCNELTEIDFPEGLETIGDYAFRGCTGFSEVVMPQSLNGLGGNAFYGCLGLESVYLNDKITSIGERMFYGCVLLTKAVLSDDTEYIDDYAFYGCDDCVLYCADNDYVAEYADFNFLKYCNTAGDFELIITPPEKTEFYLGSALDLTGLVVVADYGVGEINLESGYGVSGYDSGILGEQIVTISYKEHTAQFAVNVIMPEIVAITVQAPEKLVYDVGESLDTAGMNVTVSFVNGFQKNLDSGYEISGFDSSKEVTGQIITISYEGFETTFTIDVVDVLSTYTVTFKDIDGNLLLTKSVTEGNLIGELPQEPDLDNHKFMGYFADGIKITETTVVTADIVATATYVPMYTVTFKNDDGSVLDTVSVVEGGTAVYTGKVPTKESSAQYNYEFTGWNTSLENITADTTITAVYESMLRSYTVQFVSDGVVISEQIVNYGEVAVEPEEPVKEGNEQYTYTFTGWDKSFNNITGDIVVNAVFSETINVYNVSFEDRDGNIFETYTCAYGSEIGSLPTAPEIGGYEFIGYYNNGVEITEATVVIGDMVAKATYMAIEVTGVKIDKTNLEMTVGEKATLTATVMPENALNKSIVWSSSDESIAKVVDGVITAVGIGETTITVVTENGDHRAECLVIVIQRGTCDNLTWVVNEEKVLTITGKGNMPDYNVDSNLPPWHSYQGDIVQIVIEDGITSIGADAFYNYYRMTNVSIPESVTKIGHGAFEGSTALTELTIPSGVTTIDSYAFRGCYKITDITIPEGVTCISEHAFDVCYGLKSVKIPIGVAVIDDCAFNECNMLTDVYYDGTMSDWNEIDIGSNNTVLEKVTLHCANPTGACGENLEWTLNEDGILIISGNGDMDNYTNSYWSTSPWYEYRNDIVEVVVEDGVTGIGNYAFYNCDNLTKVSLTQTVDIFGKCVFYDCNSMVNITVDENNISFCSVDGNLFNKDKTVLVQYMPGKTNLEYAIPEGVDKINDYAFYGCTNLTNVIIPESVTTIGFYAFSGCTGLLNVKIPESVTTIGDYAFYYCDSLKSIVIPDGITEIESYTFYGCNSLLDVTLPNSIELIHYMAFGSCNNLTDVYYEGTREEWNSVTIISGTDNSLKYATKHYANPTGTCGDNLQWILDEKGILTISGKGQMTNYTSESKVPWSYYRGDITEVVIEEGVTNVGNYAFAYCYYLTEVTISDSVTDVGSYAFYSCNSLSNIYYSGSEDDWGNINVASKNDNLISANIIFGIATEFVVTFKNYDGRVLYTTNVIKGETVIYGGELPERQSTARYTYTFTGWDKSLENITSDTIITAVFDEALNYYQVIFEDVYGNIINSLEVGYGQAIGTLPVAPAVEEYNFAGYFADGVQITESTIVTGRIVVRATYSEIPKYTVSFKNYDGSILYTASVLEGETAVYSGKAPVRESTAQYNYEFTGWNKSLENITADTTVMAVYESKLRSYTVQFVSDGAVISEQTVNYGEAAIEPTAPTKESTAQYTYTFIGWDGSFDAITGDTVIDAVFGKNLVYYTVKFVDIVGNVIVTYSVGYGNRITTLPDAPQIEGYSFEGYYENGTQVTANTIVKGAMIAQTVYSPVLVKEVTLNETTLVMEEGGIEALVATVMPENALNKNVVWTSSDETVATVEDGIIVALDSGEVIITVTTLDGNYTASCVVTVEALTDYEIIVEDGVVNVKKNCDNEGETIIIAIYGSDGTMKSVQLKETDLGKYESVGYTYNKSDNDIVKVFIWKSISKMIPR